MNISALISQAVANYSGFLTDLVIDLVAILLMAYVLYFRRHWRADLLLSYVTLNIGIFVVMSLLSTVRVDIAVGFGLFAILSIIRLRSSAVTQQEVAYYFVALVMGLVNGMNVADRALVIMLNVLLLVTMAVFDSKLLRDRSRRLDVQLKKVYDSDAALVVDLERELGGRVMYHEVTEVDLGRQHTSVDVRYRPGVGVSRQGQQVQGLPVQGLPVQGLPVQGQQVQEQPVQGQQVQEQPVQGLQVQGLPVQGQPMQGQPVQEQREMVASEPVGPRDLPARPVEQAEALVSVGAPGSGENRSDRVE